MRHEGILVPGWKCRHLGCVGIELLFEEDREVGFGYVTKEDIFCHGKFTKLEPPAGNVRRLSGVSESNLFEKIDNMRFFCFDDAELFSEIFMLGEKARQAMFLGRPILPHFQF